MNVNTSGSHFDILVTIVLKADHFKIVLHLKYPPGCLQTFEEIYAVSFPFILSLCSRRVQPSWPQKNATNCKRLAIEEHFIGGTSRHFPISISKF